MIYWPIKIILLRISQSMKKLTNLVITHSWIFLFLRDKRTLIVHCLPILWNVVILLINKDLFQWIWNYDEIYMISMCHPRLHVALVQKKMYSSFVGPLQFRLQTSANYYFCVTSCVKVIILLLLWLCWLLLMWLLTFLPCYTCISVTLSIFYMHNSKRGSTM